MFTARYYRKWLLLRWSDEGFALPTMKEFHLTSTDNLLSDGMCLHNENRFEDTVDDPVTGLKGGRQFETSAVTAPCRNDIGGAETQMKSPERGIESPDVELVLACDYGHTDARHEIVRTELELCHRVADAYHSNYNAWSHRIWILEHIACCRLKVCA